MKPNVMLLVLKGMCMKRRCVDGTTPRSRLYGKDHSPTSSGLGWTCSHAHRLQLKAPVHQPNVFERAVGGVSYPHTLFVASPERSGTTVWQARVIMTAYSASSVRSIKANSISHLALGHNNSDWTGVGQDQTGIRESGVGCRVPASSRAVGKRQVQKVS